MVNSYFNFDKQQDYFNYDMQQEWIHNKDKTLALLLDHGATSKHMDLLLERTASLKTSNAYFLLEKAFQKDLYVSKPLHPIVMNLAYLPMILMYANTPRQLAVLAWYVFSSITQSELMLY